DITYTGEQWRNGGNTATDSILFDYSTALGATINSTTGFTRVTALDFTSPVATATAAALNGNTAANRATKTATITGFYWPVGVDLWLRWDDLQISGNDHGLAIDDLSVVATPEPGCIGLLAGAGFFGAS